MLASWKRKEYYGEKTLVLRIDDNYELMLVPDKAVARIKMGRRTIHQFPVERVDDVEAMQRSAMDKTITWMDAETRRYTYATATLREIRRVNGWTMPKKT